MSAGEGKSRILRELIFVNDQNVNQYLSYRIDMRRIRHYTRFFGLIDMTMNFHALGQKN